MKRIILSLVSLFLINFSYADSNDHFNWKDNTGYFEVDIKKQCESYVFEYEKYKQFAEASCKQKDMPLKNYDAEFLANCRAMYTFACDYAPSKRRQEVEKKDKLEQEQNKIEAQKMKEDNQKKEKLAKVEKAKIQCLDIGYKSETDKFKDCVLELIK
jgi:hypothetical protein